MFSLLVYNYGPKPKRPFKPNDPGSPYPRPDWDFEEDT